MKIINFSDQNSIINQYLAEIAMWSIRKTVCFSATTFNVSARWKRMRFPRVLDYESRDIATPLGIAKVNVPVDKTVLATIFRAGLPFHTGFLNVFDHAGNAFVSAYREYKDEEHTKVGIHVEYLATPSIDEKTLIIADPMLATGGSMELGFKAFLTKGTPKRIHGLRHRHPGRHRACEKIFPEDKTTIWCAAIDPGMNEHKYIVPGFGDAGDLCFGDKL